MPCRTPFRCGQIVATCKKLPRCKCHFVRCLFAKRTVTLSLFSLSVRIGQLPALAGRPSLLPLPLPLPPRTPPLLSMAATASLAATAPSPPVLKASPPALISLRPVSRRCKSLAVKTKVSNLLAFPASPQDVHCPLLLLLEFWVRDAAISRNCDARENWNEKFFFLFFWPYVLLSCLLIPS